MTLYSAVARKLSFNGTVTLVKQITFTVISWVNYFEILGGHPVTCSLTSSKFLKANFAFLNQLADKYISLNSFC